MRLGRPIEALCRRDRLIVQRDVKYALHAWTPIAQNRQQSNHSYITPYNEKTRFCFLHILTRFAHLGWIRNGDEIYNALYVFRFRQFSTFKVSAKVFMNRYPKSYIRYGIRDSAPPHGAPPHPTPCPLPGPFADGPGMGWSGMGESLTGIFPCWI